MNKLDILYNKLHAIGLRVNSIEKINDQYDIEESIVESLYFIDQDGRLLGLIFSWLKVHGNYLNADKLLREYERGIKYRGETPWFSAVCAFMVLNKDYRFKKGIIKISPKHYLGNSDDESLVKIKGSVSFLEEIGIIISQSSLRIRIDDVQSIEELIKKNRQYRNRHIFGPNWRADIITVIQNGAKNANQVAKELGINRSRVGVVFKEYFLVEKYLKS